MPPQAKTELLRAVWRIMQSFVERAFGDDPVLNLRGGSDALPNLADKGAFSDARETGAVVASGSTTIPKPDDRLAGDFRHSAKGKGRRK